MKLISKLLRILVPYWLIACASVTPPDGGASDNLPPKLLKSNPVNKSVKFSGRVITLEFTEPVIANKLSEQLKITPNTDLSNLKIKELDNQLSLVFAHDFAPNTTYALYFGNGVVDITERNIADSLSLVFSTGSSLDSGMIKGRVVQQLSGKEMAGVTVGLFDIAKDTVVNANDLTNKEATYLTRSSREGSFFFKNVKKGLYQIFAFLDVNENNRYNEPELLAYLTQPVLINEGDTAVDLKLGRIDTKAPLITNRQESDGKLVLRFAEGVESFALLNQSGQIKSDYSYLKEAGNPKQITIFGPPSATLQRLVILANDSSGNQRKDTIKTRFTMLGEPAKASKKIAPIISYIRESTTPQWEIVFPGRLRILKQTVGHLRTNTFAAPTTTNVVGDEVLREELLVMGKNITLDSSKSRLIVNQPASVSEASTYTYTLSLDTTAIEFADMSKAAISGRELKMQSQGQAASKDFGTITMLLKASSPSFAIELVRSDNTVVRTYVHWHTRGNAPLAVPALVSFDKITPGSYRVRVLVDSNENGRWDSSDRTFTHLPEPVTFPLNELMVRANWDQEATISF